MTNNLIAFDEAGNTGDYLTDTDQKYFCVASVMFEKTEVDEIYSMFRINSNELHFKQLKRKPIHQQSILEFFNSDFISEDKIKYSVSNKEFATVCHMVDLLAEPVLFRQGIDIYEKGTGYGLASVFYMLLKNNAFGEGITRKVTDLFVTMIRKKTEESKYEFYFCLRELSKLRPEYNDVLFSLLLSESIIDELLPTFELYQLDLTLTAFIYLNGLWTKQLNSEGYSIIIDNSKQLSHWEDAIKVHRSKSMMKESNFQNNLGEIQFPISIEDYKFVQSVDYREIQIADIIASGVTYMLKERDSPNPSKFGQDLIKSKLLSIVSHVIEFDQNFLEGMHDRDNSMEYNVENFAPYRKRFNF